MKPLMKMSLLFYFWSMQWFVTGSNITTHTQCIPQKMQQGGLKAFWVFLSPRNLALQVSFQKQELTYKSLANVDRPYWNWKPPYIEFVYTGFCGAGSVCYNSAFVFLPGVYGAVQSLAVSRDFRQQKLGFLDTLF